MFPHGLTRLACLETPSVNNTPYWLLALVLTRALWRHTARAQQPPAPMKIEAPADNKKDEPLVKAFSLDRAVQFLDAAAITWHQKNGCFSCHTNYSYLYARPAVSAQ